MSAAPISLHDTAYSDSLFPVVEQRAQRNTDEDAAANAVFNTAYRVAYRLLGHKQASEDAAIETVARLLEKDLLLKEYASSYAARVAARLVISSWRKEATVRKYAHLLHDEERKGEHAALRVDLRRALAKLTNRQRDIVVLRYIADLSEADVAQQMQCSVGTVKSTTHDALARLKNMVEVLP